MDWGRPDHSEVAPAAAIQAPSRPVRPKWGYKKSEQPRRSITQPKWLRVEMMPNVRTQMQGNTRCCHS